MIAPKRVADQRTVRSCLSYLAIPRPSDGLMRWVSSLAQLNAYFGQPGTIITGSSLVAAWGQKPA